MVRNPGVHPVHLEATKKEMLDLHEIHKQEIADMLASAGAPTVEPISADFWKLTAKSFWMWLTQPIGGK
jgi:hypothetical protein